MLRVFTLNDLFSANVGDGLLAESLIRNLEKVLPDATVSGLDIDGKPGYPLESGDVAVSGRQKIARYLPPFVRDPLKKMAVDRRMGRFLTSAIEMDSSTSASTALVIGGGQVITATSDYFPNRIAAVAKFAQQHRLTVVIYAVGVSSLATWEPSAAKTLVSAVRDLRQAGLLKGVYVRDALSQAHWEQVFGFASAIALDPGLIADSLVTVRPSPPHPDRPRTVGLGVMEPQVASRIMKSASPIDESFYLDAIRALDRAMSLEDSIALFTNGELEDEVFKDRILTRLGRLDSGRQVASAPRPRSPVELLELIRRFDVIAAQRMHANIGAFALGVPHVGIGWDPKLKSFFQLTHQPERFLDAQGLNAQVLAETVLSIVGQPLAHPQYDEVRAQAFGGIQALASAMKS